MKFEDLTRRTEHLVGARDEAPNFFEEIYALDHQRRPPNGPKVGDAREKSLAKSGEIVVILFFSSFFFFFKFFLQARLRLPGKSAC